MLSHPISEVRHSGVHCWCPKITAAPGSRSCQNPLTSGLTDQRSSAVTRTGRATSIITDADVEVVNHTAPLTSTLLIGVNINLRFFEDRRPLPTSGCQSPSDDITSPADKGLSRWGHGDGTRVAVVQIHWVVDLYEGDVIRPTLGTIILPVWVLDDTAEGMTYGIALSLCPIMHADYDRVLTDGSTQAMCSSQQPAGAQDGGTTTVLIIPLLRGHERPFPCKEMTF